MHRYNIYWQFPNLITYQCRNLKVSLEFFSLLLLFSQIWTNQTPDSQWPSHILWHTQWVTDVWFLLPMDYLRMRCSETIQLGIKFFDGTVYHVRFVMKSRKLIPTHFRTCRQTGWDWCAGWDWWLIKLIISIPNLCSKLLQLSFIYPSMSIWRRHNFQCDVCALFGE